MIKVVAKKYAIEENIDKILELAKELVENTIKEQGCIKYEMYQDVKDSKTLIIIEEWENSQVLSNHMASEHFNRIVPQMNELMEKSEINVCKKII